MSIEMPPFLSDDVIEAKAQGLLNLHIDVRQLPIDPVEVAKALGIDVFAIVMKEGISGALIRSETKPAIYFDHQETQTRQRFTVAHEIGHFVLHEGDFDIVDKVTECTITFRRTNDPWTDDNKAHYRREIQANKFAAALLMPTEALKSVLSDNEDMGDLARIFGVARSAVGYRVNSLGL